MFGFFRKGNEAFRRRQVRSRERRAHRGRTASPERARLSFRRAHPDGGADIPLCQPLQLFHQLVVLVRPVRLQELPLVSPGRQRGPQQQVGAQDGDEQQTAEEIEEVAGQFPGTQQRGRGPQADQPKAEGLPAGGVGDQAGRRGEDRAQATTWAPARPRKSSGEHSGRVNARARAR